MTGMRLVTKPTLGVFPETGCAVSIPAGDLVEILIAPPEGRRTVDVIWNGKQLMMFVNNLQTRSLEVRP